MDRIGCHIDRANVTTYFDDDTIGIMQRIEAHQSVQGILFLKNDYVELSTMPAIVTQKLAFSLPKITKMFEQAVSEIDVFDRLIAFRIVTDRCEVLVSTGGQFSACVLNKRKKAKKSHRRG